MTETLLQAARMFETTVASCSGSESIQVHVEDGPPLACRLLQTSAAAPLALAEGDRVLVAKPPEMEVGYILGRIAEAPAPPSTTPDAPDRVVEIVVPAGVDTVRITGRRVRIAADEELTLECAGGSVRIDQRGKVVVLGTNVTTRAKQVHKIKGASVAIN